MVLIGVLLRKQAALSVSEPVPIDLSSLKPGGEAGVQVGDYEAKISIPNGEGFSFGTMKIEIPEIGFISPTIERNGSLESVWIADVSGDQTDDAVFVIRSAGSGSYASVFVLESNGKTFRVRPLSEITAFPGYMGHDQITVMDGTIFCAFPTYVDRSSTRVDMQWKLRDGLDGELPFKKEPDSNSDPSGATITLHYDYGTHAWKKD